MWESYLLILFGCCRFYVDADHPSPPLIINQLQTTEIILGRNPISLPCHAKGEPAPTYRWTKNGEPFDFYDYHDRMTVPPWTGTLVIKNPDENDFGQYQCFATNKFGTATSNSILVQNDQYYSDMLPIPISTLLIFIKQPEVIVEAEGENATFNCEAIGFPKPEIKWIFNGKPITESLTNNRRTITNNSITIRDLIKSDTGNYGCNASNAYGYIYRDVYLNVLADVPPEFVKISGTTNTMKHHNVTLECKVFGAPKPEIRWTKYGNVLNRGRFKMTHDGNLEIADITSFDDGVYQCLVSNKLGSKTADIKLILKEFTRIVREPKDKKVIRGHDVELSCDAVADTDLELKIIWLKNGVIIDENELRFRKYIISFNPNNLRIPNVTNSDAGKYTCVAYTDLDRVEASANLMIFDVPNAPKITNIDCYRKMAVLSWELQGDNKTEISKFTIEYNTSFTPDTWEHSDEIYNAPTSQFTALVGMSPWANYTFRIIAHNSFGASPPSDPSRVCKTPGEPPYTHPKNVSGNGFTSHNMIIRWAPMPPIEHNGPGFQYRVFWKQNFTTDEWQHQFINNWQQSSLGISKTPIFQPYLIKVIALNRYGEAAAEPHHVIGYSSEAKPSKAPGNLTVIQVSEDEALFVWTKVSNDSLNGHFKGYKITVWTNEGVKLEIIINRDTDYYRVKKLHPATIYLSSIRVLNGRYRSSKSNIVSFKTLQSHPGNVQSIDVVPLGSSAFWISWKPPYRIEGQLVGYKIYYAEIHGTEVNEKQFREPIISDTRTLSAKLAGLKPNTVYRLYVIPISDAAADYDNYFEAKTHKFSKIEPDIPNFKIEEISSDNAVKVLWRPYGLRAGSHFFAKYRKKEEPIWEMTHHEMNDDYLVIRSLEPGVTYEISIAVVEGDYVIEGESQFVQLSGT